VISSRLLMIMLMGSSLLLGACAGNRPVPDSPEVRVKKVESHYRLGLDALEKNNLPKAFDELLIAEQLGPGHAEVLDALGYAWRVRGDLEKSSSYYKHALAIEPAARTWNNYGALEDPRYPHPDFAYINLGDALLMQNRFDDAIAAYRQARLLNPLQDVSLMKEAQAYREHNRPEFARAMYETILRNSPANRQALEGLLAMQQDEGEAKNQLQKFIKITQEPLDRAWAEEALKAMQR